MFAARNSKLSRCLASELLWPVSANKCPPLTHRKNTFGAVCRYYSVGQNAGQSKPPGSHCKRFFATAVDERDKDDHNVDALKLRFTSGKPKIQPWDHIFDGLSDTPPSSASSRPVRYQRSPRRKTMTAREIGVFDEMFNMVFDTVTEQKKPDPSRTDIGIGKGSVSDFFGKLRRQSEKSSWSPTSDQELDRQKEAMNLCNTDQQLLEWAQNNVFNESERYVNEAVEAASLGKNSAKLPMLQPPTYPYLIAHLMRIFRVKYKDPHLALSIFEHARSLSPASYVFGCSTQAYNELIETRWKCFRDLKGVHDALEEMDINGVEVDSQTRSLVNSLRQDVGERNLWAEDVDSDGWDILKKIESFVQSNQPEGKSSTGSQNSPSRIDSWKFEKLDDDFNDPSGFDRWDDLPRTYEKARKPPGRRRL